MSTDHRANKILKIIITLKTSNMNYTSKSRVRKDAFIIKNKTKHLTKEQMFSNMYMNKKCMRYYKKD